MRSCVDLAPINGVARRDRRADQESIMRLDGHDRRDHDDRPMIRGEERCGGLADGGGLLATREQEPDRGADQAHQRGRGEDLAVLRQE